MKPHFQFPLAVVQSSKFKVQGSRFRLLFLPPRTSGVRRSMFPDPIGIRCSMFLLLLGFWTLDSGLWTGFAAQQTNTADRLDYSSFKIITDRNIFNSHRSARYRPPTETRPQA